MSNFTVTVPDGSSNHGNPNLLCTPPNWFDYILFYFSNYFAHAATIIMKPGQGRKETISVIFAALLLPGSGVVRAIDAIWRHSRTESDPLKRALRAGALCMVVTIQDKRRETGHRSLEEGSAAVLSSNGEQPDPKNNLAEPRATDKAAKADIVPVDTAKPTRECRAEKPHERPWWNPARPRLLEDDAVVHGQYHRPLPAGYGLAFVPLEAAEEIESPDQDSNKFLASSYNFPKILISFIQAIWAIITLYRTRGDQIQQYGYAAFGLTVAPYAFMSVMNIIGSLLNPDYPAIFLVRTPLMDQVESELGGGPDRAFFAAEVLYKAVESRDRPRHHSDEKYDEEAAVRGAGLLIGCIPLAIIGGLSRFHPQNSSALQRGFTMSWVVLGIVGGIVVHLADALAMDEEENDELESFYGSFFSLRILITLVYGMAAIGGMVVVGLMIRDYGICTLLT